MKQSKKKRLVCVLLLAGIVACAVCTYAAFITSGTEKRVVAARTKEETENDALRFSSNYLSAYDKDTISFSSYPISVSNDTDVTIGITVCNYPQGNPALTNSADINYTLTLKVYDSDGSELSKANVTVDKNSGKLSGRKRSVEIHKITVPKENIEEVTKGYIQVIVQPNDLTVTGNRILAAKLQLVPASARAAAWTGTPGDNAKFSELDAYNYQISGTEHCTMQLSWNAEKVTLSDWSIKALDPNANVIDVKKSGSMTFTVGGENQPTSYMLQFYITGTKPTNWKEADINFVKVNTTSTEKN